jgi:adenylate cyclase
MPTSNTHIANPSSSDWQARSIIDWLFSEGRFIDGQKPFHQALATKLVETGAPVDSLWITLYTLNPLVISTSSNWLKSTGETALRNTGHGVRTSERYIGSPLQQLFDTEKRVRQRLDQLPVNAHQAYIELAENGLIDYLALPVRFSNQILSAFIIATRSPGGFSQYDIECFREIRNFIAPILEVYSLRHISLSLMNTYVGKRTSQKILDGMVKRGDADIIHAALWFSDLREFTHLTETLSTDKILTLLNEYFEFVSAAVTARGGEILRFIGDAMLIVFPINNQVSQKQACLAAIDSAIDAQSTLASLNHQRRRHHEAEIRFGVGLNVGEVIYGNVGALDRLDFTVMGPAVNRTARLESLTKTLGKTILFSRDFSKQLDCSVDYLGDHEMKGIAKAQAVFSLQQECYED